MAATDRVADRALLVEGLEFRRMFNQPAEVSVTNRFRDDRIGWRELVAAGSGVRLDDSPLPVASPSDELRRYPTDLLASPSDVRSATFSAAPAPLTAASPGPGVTSPALTGPSEVSTAPSQAGRCRSRSCSG